MKSTFTRALLGATLASSVALFSCGGSNKQKTVGVKPETTAVSGDLSSNLQVVEGTYELTDDWGPRLSVKLRATSPVPDATLADNDVKLTLSLLGEGSMPVSGAGTMEVEFSSQDKLMALIKRGSGEEIIEFRGMLGNYKSEQHGDKVKTFAVSGTVTKKETDVASTGGAVNAGDESAATTVSGSSDYDRMLDDYERNTDAYVKMVEGMDANDPGAMMSGYADVLTSTTALAADLEGAKGQMSNAQMNRFLKIQARQVKTMGKSPAMQVQ